MAITYRKYEPTPGTVYYDFEIQPSPNYHKSLAERLREVEQKGKPTELTQLHSQSQYTATSSQAESASL